MADTTSSVFRDVTCKYLVFKKVEWTRGESTHYRGWMFCSHSLIKRFKKAFAFHITVKFVASSCG
jgi:hypothetical protein